MRNAHARLIGTAGVVVAGAILCTSRDTIDVGKVLMPLAGVVWLIELLAMIAVGDPRTPRPG